MNYVSARSFLSSKYFKPSVKRKMVQVLLDDWILDGVKDLQDMYKAETGQRLPTSQIIRQAVIEHTKKTMATFRWYKAQEGKKDKTVNTTPEDTLLESP